MSATPAFYRSKGYTAIPVRGPLAVSPPGEVAAYQIIADTLGSKPLAQLLEPAIGYAEEGFPIPRSIHRSIVGGQETLRQFPEAAAIYLKDGEPYREGDVLVQRDLAGTLGRVARGVSRSSTGATLRGRSSRGSRRRGASSRWTTWALSRPSSMSRYPQPTGGYTVLETRPPSQGMLLLEMLNIIEGFDIGALGFLSPQCIHVMVVRPRSWPSRTVTSSCRPPDGADAAGGAVDQGARRAAPGPSSTSTGRRCGRSPRPWRRWAATRASCARRTVRATRCRSYTASTPTWIGVRGAGHGDRLQQPAAGFRLEEGHPNTMARGSARCTRSTPIAY